jgi:4-hydroxy-tetrahydrodipicolinate synthase
MAKHVTIEGCLTALVTPFRPFRDGGKVDFEGLARLVDWQIEQGVDGIVSVGTTGESATLDVEEHVAVITATVKAARGRVPVIAGAGGNSTSEALELTRASEAAGANALLHVTPYYNRPSQEGLFRHFEAVARATKLPIILYNVPSRTACDLLTETVARLAELDNVVGIKDATGNLARGGELIARVGERMAVLSGDDATAFPLYAIGARGVISVVSNVAPRAMSDMWTP